MHKLLARQRAKATKASGEVDIADRACRFPSLKVLFTSGYTENAIVHHGRLDPGVLLPAKPYRNSELARMVRRALTGAEPAPQGQGESRGQPETGI